MDLNPKTIQDQIEKKKTLTRNVNLMDNVMNQKTFKLIKPTNQTDKP